MALEAFLVRSGIVIKRLAIVSASLSFALNEIREHNLEVSGRENILEGDAVRFSISNVTYGDYEITIFDHSFSSALGYSTTMTLVPCLNVLQSVAMPGNDPFEKTTNLSVFTHLSAFILQETGFYFPISFVNADSVAMGAHFAVNASNALDMLRSLCGATGNAFRLSESCGIEVGKFGESSGMFIKTGGNGRYKNILYPTSVRFSSDSSDIYGAVYADGGSFTKKENPSDPDDKGKSVNLQMGSYYITQFTITPPDGFTMATSVSGEKTYYKLTKNGAPITKSKKIQVGGITPIKENDLQSEIDAATLLTEVASRYITAKCVPNIVVTCRFEGFAQDFNLGETVRVYLADETRKSKDTIIDEDLYVTGIEYSTQTDTGFTSITLSNRISDPEDLLQSAKGSAAGDSGYKPYQEFGQYSNIVIATVMDGSPVCDSIGREISVNYAAYGYIDPPHITINCPSGYSAVITSSDAENAVICVTAMATWPTTPIIITLILSGARA